MIPQAAPALRIDRYRAEIDVELAAVLSGSQYILGPAVAAFEAAFAQYLGVAHCIGVASGTDALALALRAAGVGPGSEVITPALTFCATAQAVLQCGATPHFVDVDATTRCVDPQAVADAVSTKTAAILPVHLFGQPADMPRLMEVAERHHLLVIEDCAHAHGAAIDGRKVGSFGHAAAFSFYPTKNLGGVGDGGAVVTRDAGVARALRQLRQYGWRDGTQVSASLGYNSRLDEIQAAILSVLLRRLDEGNAERRAIARQYGERLKGLPIELPPYGEGVVFHQYAIACEDRDEAAQGLRSRGVGAAVHYSPGLHRHPAFSEARRGVLSRTESLTERLLSLPIQPEIAFNRVEEICAAVAGAIA